MTNTTNAASVAELPNAVRVPLDSLHADAAYLIGRLREGSMSTARGVEIIRERIDAAKAALAASPQQPAMSQAARDVLAERQRQITTDRLLGGPAGRPESCHRLLWVDSAHSPQAGPAIQD